MARCICIKCYIILIKCSYYNFCDRDIIFMTVCLFVFLFVSKIMQILLVGTSEDGPWFKYQEKNQLNVSIYLFLYYIRALGSFCDLDINR